MPISESEYYNKVWLYGKMEDFSPKQHINSIYWWRLPQWQNICVDLSAVLYVILAHYGPNRIIEVR